MTRFRGRLPWKPVAAARVVHTGDSNQRLMAAEVARELGDFADSKSLLEYNFPEEYSRAVTLIRRLVDEGDAKVVQLT